MTQWLIDTFVYTGLLIALVLLVRRRVAQNFGPQVAYALWSLPLLRLAMPPLVLPAWMAPEQAGPAPASDAMVIMLSEATANATEAGAMPPPQVGIEVMDLLVPLWLAGAAFFLVWRARDYLAMRRELLAEARPVGEAGKVRLVETPAVTSPVAFGIGDKVIALPPEFMAHHDIAARDMAIAHELAHHRGYDLVANIAAQPLLALHWFNPLAWWGWRAMRSDQEAACDARVVAGRARSERAAYAEVIAGFAAGPNLALAVSMACPVLGEKSIIHRLRSLTMTDVSSRRKKLGIAAIATTALVALPVTASITYAQEEAPPAPEAPAAPAAPAAPDAPAAPEAPLPPVPPSIEMVDPDGPHRVIPMQLHGDEEAGDRRVRRVIIDRDGDLREFSEREFIDEEEIERMMAEVEREMEAIEESRHEMRLAFVEAREAQAEAAHERALAMRSLPEVRLACDGEDTVSHRELEDGSRVMVICKSAASNQAGLALREALRAIEQNRSLPAAERQQIISELQQAIAQLESLKVSAVSIAPKVPAVPPVRSIQVKAQVPAPPIAPVPARVVRASSITFRAWQQAPAASEADCKDEEAAARITT